MKKNDTLIFKYYGDSKFEVNMFVGDINIEKACCHFLEKALHDPANSAVTEIHPNGSARKRRAKYKEHASFNDDSAPELVSSSKKSSMKLDH